MQIPSDPWDPRAALSAKTGGGASSPSCSCVISQCFDTSPTCIRTRYGRTAASLAIGSGADVKVVQHVLGYKSATMTLDRYGHLFGDRLDVVADGIDAPRRWPVLPIRCGTLWSTWPPSVRWLRPK
jgi:hypothetical protein